MCYHTAIHRTLRSTVSAPEPDSIQELIKNLKLAAFVGIVAILIMFAIYLSAQPTT